MPEPGSEADEAVRDARQAVYRVDQGRQLACQQVTPMSDDLNLEAALDAYEAAIRASERAKVEALLEAAESTIAAADESRAQARAQWEAQMTTGFPCRTCGAPARHWEHGMSGNWNSQPASYPACNDHATFYHFYSADLSGIRAAIDAVRAGRAS